jgi:hypothetical protein
MSSLHVLSKMKLRAYVLLMLIANLLLATLQSGWFEGLFGGEGRSGREPTRVLQQVRPSSVGVTPINRVPAPASPSGSQRPLAPLAPPAPAIGPPTPPSSRSQLQDTTVARTAAAIGPRCLEAGPFDALELVQVESHLGSTAASALRRLEAPSQPSFATVLGPFTTREALRAKVDELERLSIDFERAAAPAGPRQPSGLTLLVVGRSAVREGAEAMLRSVERRGVRAARILEMPSGTRTKLRADDPNESVWQALRDIGSGVLGKPFAACAS